jgi:hypothetical protein
MNTCWSSRAIRDQVKRWIVSHRTEIVERAVAEQVDQEDEGT